VGGSCRVVVCNVEMYCVMGVSKISSLGHNTRANYFNMQSTIRSLLRTPALRSGLWMQQQQGMATGTVKWFNMARGFGFIVEDGGAEREGKRSSFDRSKTHTHHTHTHTHMYTVFVHQTSIQTEGFRYLKDGEEVEFEINESDKGPQAVNVTGPNGAELERIVSHRDGHEEL
jgi:cold shock protein